MVKSLIVGLGNPGKEYTNTPHNLGFAVVDVLVKLLSSESFREEKKFQCVLVEARNTLFVKPHTFMNKSGECVGVIAAYYKIPVDHIIVVHDDFDIPFGELKISKGKGPKNHGGINSIIVHVKSEDFTRYRLGIRKEGITNLENYVLSPFHNSEISIIEKLINDTATQLKQSLVV